jgi:hypothetical protein
MPVESPPSKRPKRSPENQQAQIPQQPPPGQPQQGVPGGYQQHLQNGMLNGMRPPPSQPQHPGVPPNMAPNSTFPPGMVPMPGHMVPPGMYAQQMMPPVSRPIRACVCVRPLTCRPRARRPRTART